MKDKIEEKKDLVNISIMIIIFYNNNDIYIFNSILTKKHHF